MNELKQQSLYSPMQFQIYPTELQSDLLDKWISSYSAALQKFLYRAWKHQIFPSYAEAPLDLPPGARSQLLQDTWMIHNNYTPDFTGLPSFRLASKRYALIRTGELSFRNLKIQTYGVTIPKDQRATTLTIFKKNEKWYALILLKDKQLHRPEKRKVS